eukprot:XP_015584075.1 uncharacterized protein LOC107262501 [Ricinus communis]
MISIADLEVCDINHTFVKRSLLRLFAAPYQAQHGQAGGHQCPARRLRHRAHGRHGGRQAVDQRRGDDAAGVGGRARVPVQQDHRTARIGGAHRRETARIVQAHRERRAGRALRWIGRAAEADVEGDLAAAIVHRVEQIVEAASVGIADGVAVGERTADGANGLRSAAAAKADEVAQRHRGGRQRTEIARIKLQIDPAVAAQARRVQFNMEGLGGRQAGARAQGQSQHAAAQSQRSVKHVHLSLESTAENLGVGLGGAAAQRATDIGVAVDIGAVGERGEVVQHVGAGDLDVAGGQLRRRRARVILREHRRFGRLQFETGAATALGAKVDHAGQAGDGVAGAQRTIFAQIRDHGRRDENAIVQDDLVALVRGGLGNRFRRARTIAVGGDFQAARRQRDFAAVAEVFQLRYRQRIGEAHQHALHLTEVGVWQLDVGRRDADAAGQLDDGGDVLHLGVRARGAGRRVFGDRAADADLVAHLHRADVGGGGEDEQAVRGLRIAVALRVLDEEAGADLGGHHALGGLHRAGVRASLSRPLDLRNRMADRGRRGHADTDRASCLLRLVIGELDRDRIAAGLHAGGDAETGGGGAASARRGKEVDQADAGHGGRGDRRTVDGAIGVGGAEIGAAIDAEGQRQVGRASGHDRWLLRHTAGVQGAGAVAWRRRAGGEIIGVVVGVGAAAVSTQRGGGVAQARSGAALIITGGAETQQAVVPSTRVGLTALDLTELDRELEQSPGQPAWLDNDGNAAANGESLLGAPQRRRVCRHAAAPGFGQTDTGASETNARHGWRARPVVVRHPPVYAI